jgi:LPXTG-motif cell wall-anchored protein
MKKLVSLLIIAALIITVAGTCFADNDESERNVNTATYREEYTELHDTSQDIVELDEEMIPAAGGIPAELFYAAGALLIAAAVLLMRKKNSAEQKH